MSDEILECSVEGVAVWVCCQCDIEMCATDRSRQLRHMLYLPAPGLVFAAQHDAHWQVPAIGIVRHRPATEHDNSAGHLLRVQGTHDLPAARRHGRLLRARVRRLQPDAAGPTRGAPMGTWAAAAAAGRTGRRS
jgi:hypothetical protein